MRDVALLLVFPFNAYTVIFAELFLCVPYDWAKGDYYWRYFFILQEEQVAETSTKVSRKMKINNIDWCILFGNAQDNALEALTRVTQQRRWLKIIIKNIGNMLCTEIQNSMSGTLEYNAENCLKTNKRDKQLHGIGLKSIRECVKKYDGELEITAEENTFCLTFILCGG